MKRWIVFVLLLSPAWVSSQFYFYDENYLDPAFLVEAGFGAGWMGSNTDLGEKGLPFSPKSLHSAIAFFGRVQWHRGVAIKVSYTSGRVSAADSLIKGQGPGDAERKKRNLHFFSSIREVACTLEWLPRTSAGQYGGLQPVFAAGAGFFHFNPEGEIEGKKIELAKLRTEGGPPQPYKLQQVNIIAGLGLRYEWNARVATTILFEHRFLFTDHLDDVSGRFIDPYRNDSQQQEIEGNLLKDWYKLSDPVISRPGAIRGNPEKRDSYSTLSFTVGWGMNRKRLR